jgi:moderate conductance mechanosensitive channel
LTGVQLLAQDTAELERVCGVGFEGDWLCSFVYERTGDELLGRVAGVANTVVAVLLILIVAWVLVRISGRFVLRFAARMEERIQERLERAHERGAITDTQRFRTRRLQRLQAITGVSRGALGAAIWLIAFLLVLGRIGVPLQPLLAGAGLIGIVVGFGAQQLVRDVLAGIAMLIEDQYGVGDWIEVEDKFGMVERVGLRSTAMRDVDGVVHHILNGYIQRVGNLSQSWARSTFDVPMALDTDIATARTIIWDVASALTQDPVWGSDAIGPPELWGVQSWGPEGMTIRVVIPTKPLRNWEFTRQLRERLKLAFDEAGIRMPSSLVDVGGMHTGYAVLTRDLPPKARDDGGARRDGHSRRDAAEDSGEFTEAPRDRTAELRLQRGPEARPD